MDVALLLARLILAAVFAVAAAGKLADLAGSRDAVAGFGVPQPVANVVGTLLPFAELAVAALLPFAATGRAGAFGALFLLLVFSGGIGLSIARGDAPDCHCFGQIHSEPAGPRTLVRNLLLVAIAAFAAFAGPDPGLGLFEAIGDLSAAGAVALAGGVLLILLATAGVIAVLGLLRQNGRLLLRFEQLEQALREHGIALPQEQPADSGPGLAIGAEAPEFSLPGLHGETATLASLRAHGRPVLLMFTDPNCTPCRAMLPKVGGWQRDLTAQVTVAVISRGTADQSRAEAGEHGLTTVLFETNAEVSTAYGGTVTPSAVLVEAGGTIDSNAVAGQGAIEGLVQRTARPGLDVVQVPPAPPVIATGEPLPAAPLRDLDGSELNLFDALGDRERVLLFWDPGCGFCRRMVDDLRAAEQGSPTIAETLLLISRGAPQANRAEGLKAQIVLEQEVFGLGRAVGVPGTPSAILVDVDGRLRGGPAIGADAVLALLSEVRIQG
jgi:methylamine dehydrogenase accessory protein MauD